MVPHLFVYGTLRRSARNRFARALHRQSRFVGEARVNARKRRVGGFFAMVLCKEETVDGELFRLRDPERLLAVLDEYEGPAYRRTLLKATTSSGKCFRCWSYVYRFRLGRA
ncbi:MAG: gamma-glutamylcyclotransferase family protein [Bryobacteraceae bacterium]